VWREAESTPFGVPTLDLTPVTRNLLSTTPDPALAKRSTSWRGSTGAELDEHADDLSDAVCRAART
jgi:hypothetical protein